MSGAILGTATILAAPAACLVILIRESDGETIAKTTAAADGSYEFDIQPEGNYALVFLDPAGQYRGKVAHVTVLL
jgi:hypothetical protein